MKRKTTLYDMTGTKWNKLTVIERAGSISGKAAWKCRCDCGKECIVNGDNMRNGHTTSCGCERKRIAREESAKKRAEKNPNANYSAHGDTRTRLYDIWSHMKSRCSRPYDPRYKDYGGRGISVCEEWQMYGSFQKWAIENGYKDDLTIERIDNDKNYCPENCTWIPKSDQAKNRRINVMYTENGVTRNMREWAKIKGINYGTVQCRRKRGWTLEKALNTPVKKYCG